MNQTHRKEKERVPRMRKWHKDEEPGRISNSPRPSCVIIGRINRPISKVYQKPLKRAAQQIAEENASSLIAAFRGHPLAGGSQNGRQPSECRQR